MNKKKEQKVFLITCSIKLFFYSHTVKYEQTIKNSEYWHLYAEERRCHGVVTWSPQDTPTKDNYHNTKSRDVGYASSH